MSPPGAGPAVTLDSVGVHYRKLFALRPALRGVDLEARPGTVTALVGENGAGKTTLLRTVLGFLAPAEGLVRIDGEAPGTYRRRQGVAYVPEAPRLPAGWTVRELLVRGAHLAGLDPDAALDHVRRKLDAVSGASLLSRRGASLSKGQLRRISIAYALLGDPALVVLDEPFTGLDPRGRSRVRGLVRSLAEGGGTVLVSTHEVLEMQEGADVAVVLSAGRVASVLRGAELEAGALVRHFDGDDA